MQTKNDSTLKMTTLSEQVNESTRLGYTDDFEVKDYGIVSESGKVYTSDQVAIVNFYRYEGYSDPNDSSILYLLETTDGVKGKIIDAYGADSSELVTNFIGDVESIQKKE
jgi:hypothetical protein